MLSQLKLDLGRLSFFDFSHEEPIDHARRLWSARQEEIKRLNELHKYVVEAHLSLKYKTTERDMDEDPTSPVSSEEVELIDRMMKEIEDLVGRVAVEPTLATNFGADLVAVIRDMTDRPRSVR